MEIETPAVVKQVISKIDLEAVADDVVHARKKVVELGRSALGDVRSVIRRHPGVAAAVAGGLGMLAVVGTVRLISRSLHAR